MRKSYQVSKPAKTGAWGKKRAWIYRQLRMVGVVFGLMGSFFLLDSVMLNVVHHISFRNHLRNKGKQMQDGGNGYDAHVEKSKKLMYESLVKFSSTALAKNELPQDPFTQWKEPQEQASSWKPCADKSCSTVHQGNIMKGTGFILVSANGGLNQQRVAVCNAVAIAAMLNASLVLPKFLYSSVWKDKSQFGDIYQEDYFINFLKDDVKTVKELPPHLQSLDLKSIGSQVTDIDIWKESKPIYFTKVILPLLLRNGVVHFLGFGNRLAFDPIPANLQKLRCKCNFHALKFVPRIQKMGSLLVKRLRKYDSRISELDKQLLGKHIPNTLFVRNNTSLKPLKYLALHMRFEIDMVAYSVCDFGGGEKERMELQAYREIHFPALVQRMKEENVSFSPAELRKLGRCPLTPEEATLMLSALGFKQRTYIYLAGSNIYGGRSRMLPFTRLYPNLVTKEDLLTPTELAPFTNFSSQITMRGRGGRHLGHDTPDTSLEQQEQDDEVTQEEEAPEDEARPDNRTLLHGSKTKIFSDVHATRRATDILKRRWTVPWLCWRDVPGSERDRIWEYFMRIYWCIDEDIGLVRDTWEATMQRRMTGILDQARRSARSSRRSDDYSEWLEHYPRWMNADVWSQMLNKWNTDEWRQRSQTARTNRLTEKEGEVTKYAGGSISLATHRERMGKAEGREPSQVEVFIKTHKKKGTDEFIDGRSRKFMEDYNAGVTAKYGGECSSQRPIDADIWMRAAGDSGRGRVYGYSAGESPITPDSRHSRSTHASPPPTQPSFSQDQLTQM